MVRVAKYLGSEHVEAGGFQLPGSRRPGEPDNGQPARCWPRSSRDNGDRQPEPPRLSLSEEEAANERARAAIDAAIPGLPPARPDIPRCTVLQASILAAAVQGRSRFDLMQDGLKGIDGGQLCRAIDRMQRAGWLNRAMRTPPSGKRLQLFLSATPDGERVLQEFLDFADSLGRGRKPDTAPDLPEWQI